ncbi:MAG: hypothetical protein KBS81_07575, partial [Spirochaetales bacterium]|nr:hypothetical protein [Candidatus Physcosoma equi]
QSIVVGGNFIYRIDENALSIYDFAGYNMYTSKPMVVYDYSFSKDEKQLTMKSRDAGFEDYVLIKK